MERESPCSCRSTCEKDELSPALGQRPQPGCAKPLLGSTLDPPPVRTGARDSSGLGSTLTCHRSGQVTTGGPCTPGPPPPWTPGGQAASQAMLSSSSTFPSTGRARLALTGLPTALSASGPLGSSVPPRPSLRSRVSTRWMMSRIRLMKLSRSDLRMNSLWT